MINSSADLLSTLNRAKEEESRDSRHQTLRGTLCVPAPTALSPPSPTQSTHIKTGYLSKQSDHLRIWKTRYFVLDSSLLHYYLHEADRNPRGCIDLSDGMSTVTDPQSIPPATQTTHTYAFTLSHPESSTEFHLSSSNISDAIAWVHAIRQVISSRVSDSIMSFDGLSPTPSHDYTPNEGEESLDFDFSRSLLEFETSDPTALHLEAVYEGINNSALADKIDSAVSLVVKYCGSMNSEGKWLRYYDSDGLRCYRRTERDVLMVRAEILIQDRKSVV